MIWSVIGDVYCSEQNLQELILITSDRSWLEENFSNWTLGNVKTASVVSILEHWKSIWTPQILPAPAWFDSFGLIACPGVMLGLFFFFVLNSPHLPSPETAYIWDTGSLSTFAEICYMLLHHAPRKLLRCWEVPLTRHTWSFGFGHHISLPPLKHPSFVVPAWFFCWRDYPASTAPTRASVGACRPRAPQLVAYFWISVWHEGESLPQHEKRSRSGSFAVRRPHAKPEAVRSTFAVQTNSRSEIVFSCPQ